MQFLGGTLLTHPVQTTALALYDDSESELQYLDMSININKSVPGLARVTYSPVVTYFFG